MLIKNSRPPYFPMTDAEYHKFGSNPPINQNNQYPNNANYQPNQQQNPNQNYYPPSQNQQNYYGQPVQQPMPQYNNYNYGNPQYGNQYGENAQVPPPQNMAYGQPVYVPQQAPVPVYNNYHSTLQCLIACLAITMVYQVVLIIFFGINGNEIEFPSNVVGGFLCSIFDLVLLILAYIYFKNSRDNKQYCKYGFILFIISLVLFILTYVITFSTTYYYVGNTLYSYSPSIYYLIIQIIFRALDLVMGTLYVVKRMQSE